MMYYVRPLDGQGLPFSWQKALLGFLSLMSDQSVMSNPAGFGCVWDTVGLLQQESYPPESVNLDNHQHHPTSNLCPINRWVVIVQTVWFIEFVRCNLDV